MYDKVLTNLDFVEREKEILSFWKDNKIFEKSIESRKDGEVFTFFDGPPTANGKPHIGHILTRVVKDIIPRYKTMKGYKVLRKAGWDTHGLPVELEIEKKLGISGKPQIEEYGVEPFIKQCKDSVFTYESLWRTMSDRVGFWADMDNPYVTYHNSYIESVWWALKQIWDKGLLYKGHKIVPYCPRCGTSLSSHEVAQGYKDVKDKSAYAKFLVKGTTNEFLLAWTTTPWTLPSNVALTVNADECYVKVALNDEKYILAEALVSKVFGEEETPEVIQKCKGIELKGLEYEPLFDYAKDIVKDQKAYYVVCDSYVTLTDGTGIVHCAPAFGEDDARVGKDNNLPFVQLVNEEGKFLKEVTDWAGVFVKDADEDIIKKLKQENKLLKAENYEHSYPFCWRCDTPLLYYARDTWFIAMTKVRDMLVKNNNTVNWMPDNIKQGRFGNFLENVIDWGLSRERYWGTPLPIWECSCGHKEAIGSIEQLKSMSSDCPEDIELHKPYIDNVHLNCPKCSQKMTRVTEVIDCWFDSGCMPFAQWHYPFENEEIFKQNFPADFISEAIDQTRGWFYTLMAISTLLFDKSPYKNVIVLGHVQDKDGKKMSKHTGNVVDPWTILDKQGADAVRWYFYTNSSPWLPNRFYEEAVNEGQRKFMGTLWNTYAFFVLYANIDNFDPNNYTLEYDKLPPMDKWILSKLNSLVKFIDDGLENYKLTETSRAMSEFVDELSNWYVRRSRERFWGKDMPQDKVNAYMTLYTVLVTLTKLSAPFTPFIAESIYQNLVCKVSKNEPESVHLCDFPTYDEKLIDKKLEEDMDTVLSIVVAGRSGRNTANIKNRQPIGNMFVKSNNTLDNMFIDIIKEELNIKNVEFKDDVSAFTSYSFKPQLRTLGKKYGKLVPAIGNYLKENDGIKLMNELKENGLIKFTIDNENIELSQDDVLIETAQMEGYVAESDKNITIVLDTNLTEELLEEGFVREIISKVQTMRKEAEFEVLDKITVYHNGNDNIANIICKNIEQIKEDVLATDIINGSNNGYSKEWNINGEKVTLTVVKN
ncbi:MAG: isoleucine--tRNA ligase [Clostridiales bacterium]|nr:isoleucine--tRNA ligase [Clostridiales bacterium]